MTEAAMLVDHLFRHAAGQMVSSLTRTLGPSRIDLAEEVVQDALLKALQVWPYSGIPDNPRGWLFRVARNRALDVLRREQSFDDKLAILPVPSGTLPLDDAALVDDELAMVFMCCHPDLPAEAGVALTLKTVGGFDVREIAAAFLAEQATIAQRLVRAKKLIRERGIRFDLPGDAERAARLSSVLDVLYLMFNEGYSAHDGETVVRTDLCHEAIRLCRMIVEHRATRAPRAWALLALMLLQASRLPARMSDDGRMLLLAEQDRTRWDESLIKDGMQALRESLAGAVVTDYHREAAIAACHATAADDSSTDWPLILELYDELSATSDSPVIALNRAVAVARVYGTAAGMAELDRLRAQPLLRNYYLLPALLAGLSLEAGDRAGAARWYREALALPCNRPEREFMLRRLSECEAA